MAGGFEAIEEWDLQLSRAARSAGALQVGLGMALERLARSGGHHELGFASIEAYALERCERSARWVQLSRALARRLEALPALRCAVTSGHVSFCMAQVIAQVASPEDENIWLAEAETQTVRQMRTLVKERETARSDDGGDDYDDGAASSHEKRGTLTVTVAREEAWLFECARTLVKHIGGTTLEDTLEALVAEGTTALLPDVPRGRMPSFDESSQDAAQRAWEAQLAAWRDEAEARCESQLAARLPFNPVELFEKEHSGDHGRSTQVGTAVEPRAVNDVADAHAFDTELRRLAAELARKDLSIGRLAESFWKADGWHRLGYATASQYARERLGCSLSSIKAKRVFARRVDALPEVTDALEQRELGYEAARLVAVIATPETAGAWVERARVRTVKHLREEIDAVQMLGRLAGRRAMLPPSDDVMRRVAVMESRVVSGDVFRGGDPGQMFAGLAALAEPENGTQPTRDGRAASQGRVTLRFRASVGLIRYYRWLEGVFQRHRPEPVSCLRYLCASLIDSWKQTLETNAAYASIYARDRFRCTSPVCTRRDLTPHHLQFRSHGGDDSDENVASLCVWCHLEGVHGGAIAAQPPASNVEWTIGRTPHTVVFGRVRAA